MPSRRSLLAVAGAALAGCLGGDAPTTRTDRGSPAPSLTGTPRPNDGASTGSPGDRATPTPVRDPLSSVGGAWPQFAGDAAGTGVRPVTGPGQATTRWYAPVPACSHPVVAAGRVFVGTIDGRLVALDARTGRRRWERPVAHPGVDRHLDVWTRTPAVHAGTVYAASGFGDPPNYLRAFGLEGGERWRYPDDGGFEEAVAPVVTDRGVLLGTDAGLTLVGHDGTRQWHVELEDGQPAVPPAVEAGVAHVPVRGRRNRLVSVADGRVQGETALGTGVLGVPAAREGRVLVGVERYHDQPFDQPTVYEHSAADATGVFSTAGRGPPAVCLPASGTLVAGVTTRPADTTPTTPVTTREVTRTPGPGETVTPGEGPPTKPAHCYRLDADGEPAWQTPVGHRSRHRHPAVGSEAVYVTNHRRIRALDRETGQERWTLSVGSERTELRAGPAVVDGAVFVVGDDGVYAVGSD